MPLYIDVCSCANPTLEFCFLSPSSCGLLFNLYRTASVQDGLHWLSACSCHSSIQCLICALPCPSRTDFSSRSLVVITLLQFQSVSPSTLIAIQRHYSQSEYRITLRAYSLLPPVFPSVLVLPPFLSVTTPTFIPPSKLGTMYIARRNAYVEAEPLPLQARTLLPCALGVRPDPSGPPGSHDPDTRMDHATPHSSSTSTQESITITSIHTSISVHIFP